MDCRTIGVRALNMEEDAATCMKKQERYILGQLGGMKWGKMAKYFDLGITLNIFPSFSVISTPRLVEVTIDLATE